jgi:hypothetical protein
MEETLIIGCGDDTENYLSFDVSNGLPHQNPKSEIRGPKEIRSPKTEGAARLAGVGVLQDELHWVASRIVWGDYAAAFKPGIFGIRI